MGLYPGLPTGVTDRSVTIAAGGTAQQAAAAKNNRRYLMIQNKSTSGGSAWFSTRATAVADSPSIELQPGQTYVADFVVPTGAVSVLHPTTGTKITVIEA